MSGNKFIKVEKLTNIFRISKQMIKRKEKNMNVSLFAHVFVFVFFGGGYEKNKRMDHGEFMQWYPYPLVFNYWIIFYGQRYPMP